MLLQKANVKKKEICFSLPSTNNQKSVILQVMLSRHALPAKNVRISDLESDNGQEDVLYDYLEPENKFLV